MSKREERVILNALKQHLTIENTDSYDAAVFGRRCLLRNDDIEALDELMLFLRSLPPIKGRDQAVKLLLSVLAPNFLDEPKKPRLTLVKSDRDER